MAPPAGYTDFYELELEINYNNASNAYLQYESGSNVQPPQERQAGWTERYNLYLTTPPSGTNLPVQNAYTLIQARAALLGINYYIKKAICHQASAFKSSWPMANSAKYPLFDSIAATTSATPIPSAQYCSAPEETLMLRLEAGSLRRWEHQMRGIKDYLSDDAMSFFAATSYADAATFATTSVFDSAQQTIPVPGLTGAAKATFTVTNTAGSISTPVLVSGGNWPQVADGTYSAFFFSDAGYTVPAVGTITIAGNVATAATINANFQGSGYTGTSVYVPLSNDPNGLQNYLTPATYWANFISCLISFTQSGTTQRIAQSTYTAPVPSFPSGLVPAIFGSPVKCNRSMLQRVGNRQTGQIRLTKPARRKIAR